MSKYAVRKFGFVMLLALLVSPVDRAFASGTGSTSSSSSTSTTAPSPTPTGITGSDPEPIDLTREPLMFPADRATRLQNLARGDEGFLLGMAYSTQRGYAESHPFAGEIRMGEVDVVVCPEELGFVIEIGSITLTECQMINQFHGGNGVPPQFTRGYGLAMGEGERKAMSMALVDRALRCDELAETSYAPAQNQEFVLSHSDSVEASGFVQHLKLPHYVDFQAELSLLRMLAAQNKKEDADEQPESVAGGARS